MHVCDTLGGCGDCGGYLPHHHDKGLFHSLVKETAGRGTMALIECPECGKEVSDKANKCIGCGHVFREETHDQKGESEGCLKCVECGAVIVDARSTKCPYCGCPIEKKGVARIVSMIDVDKKRTKILAAVAVAVLVVAIFAFASCSGVFDPDKRLAIDSAKSYQSALKNPESLSIRGDFTIVRCKDDDGETKEYCYFSATSQNGLGGNTSSVPLCVDGEYRIDAEGDYSGGSTDETLSNGDKIGLQFQWRIWQLDGFPENSEVSTVDGESVAKAVGVPCYK